MRPRDRSCVRFGDADPSGQVRGPATEAGTRIQPDPGVIMKIRLPSVAAGLLAAAASPLMAQSAAVAPDSDAVPIAASAVAPAAVPAGCPDAALSPLQQRLLAKWDRSPHVLMQYVWITRSIHQLDRMETAQWAERYRVAHPKC
jgi:hypothetical protein